MMLQTSAIVALIESNPNGMTTKQIAETLCVDIKKAVGKLSKANAYGLISKRRGEQCSRHNTALWLPKAKVTR